VSGVPDGFEDIDGALERARGHVEEGNGAEASVRALLPVVGMLMKDLRRLADAAERIAEAVEASPAPPPPRR
jgi:hypothetical protein